MFVAYVHNTCARTNFLYLSSTSLAVSHMRFLPKSLLLETRNKPEYLPSMIEKLSEKSFVIGSRYVDGGGTKDWGLIRRVISRGGSFYARVILGLEVRDLTGGFNGWTRDLLKGIDLDNIRSEGYAFQIELKYRAIKSGGSYTEVPIIFEDRRVGQSKMSFKIALEALYRVWQIKFKS